MKVGRDQLRELAAGFILLKFTPESRSGRDRILLLNTTHHHTKMRSFYNNSYTQRIQSFFDRMQYLCRQALLNLQPAGINIYYPCDLAKPRDPPIRNISDMRFPKKR